MIRLSVKSYFIQFITSGALLFLCLTVMPMTGCQKNSMITSTPLPAEPRRITIDTMVLDKAALKQMWIIPKLGPEGSTLKQIDYNNGRLFAVSSANQLYILDGATGHLLASSKLSSEASYCSSPCFFRDQVVYLAGNEIVEFQQADGKEVHRQVLNFSPATNVARTYDAYFVGGNDYRLYCQELNSPNSKWISVQPQSPTGILQATDLKTDLTDPNSLTNNDPLKKDDGKTHDLIIFAGKDNIVYASRAEKREMIWQAPATGRIPGVVLTETFCLVPSEDTALRCFDAVSGQLLWKYLSGGKLQAIPAVTERHIYQRIGQQSLICLLKKPASKLGKLKWELPGGVKLLAENGQLSWAITSRQEVACMDNTAGKPVLSFYVPDADLFVTNTQSPTLFLANRNGSIVALDPAK